MQPGETHGGSKIQSSKFRDWLSLDTNHMVVAFDSDQNANGQGFVLQVCIIQYYTVLLILLFKSLESIFDKLL